MTSAPQNIFSWLLMMFGHKLLEVNGLFHIFNFKQNGGPQEIELLFDNASGKLYCEKDGSSLGVSTEPMVGCDLGEYGSQVVFSISNESYFSNVMGSRLFSVSVVKSSAEQAVIGVIMKFDNGCQVSILNLGDDIYVYDNIPEAIVHGEGLIFFEVK